MTECNCSICRRYGVRWAYYKRSQVKVSTRSGSVTAYRWGGKTIDFIHCNRCGCITHYESVKKTPDSRLAVNGRLLPLDVQKTLPVKYFDGNQSWKYIDEKDFF